MDLENLRKILSGDEKYRLFQLTEYSNEKHYGDDYRKCAGNILKLLDKLIIHFNSDFGKELSYYCQYVAKYNEDHRKYLETRRYAYSRISDLGKNREWQRFRQKYPFILLFSIILSTHRFEMYNYFRKCLRPYLEKGGRCLEVGTGSGVDAEFLSKYFDLKTYDNSNISSECLEVLFPELKKCFEGKPYDFRQDNCYDLGVMTELLEHLENPPAVLKKFRKVLKPGGLGFLTFAIRMPQIDHIYHFRTVEEVKKMLKKIGLDIQDEYYAISSLSYITQDHRKEYAVNPKYPVNYCCLVKK